MIESTILDSFVILKGSQLNLVHHHSDKEHLPASAGLPSAGGLYRSKSIGGKSLNGIAGGKKLITNLLKTPSRQREKWEPLDNRSRSEKSEKAKRSNDRSRSISEKKTASQSTGTTSTSRVNRIRSRVKSTMMSEDNSLQARRVRSLQAITPGKKFAFDSLDSELNESKKAKIPAISLELGFEQLDLKTESKKVIEKYLMIDQS